MLRAGAATGASAAMAAPTNAKVMSRYRVGFMRGGVMDERCTRIGARRAGRDRIIGEPPRPHVESLLLNPRSLARHSTNPCRHSAHEYPALRIHCLRTFGRGFSTNQIGCYQHANRQRRAMSCNLLQNSRQKESARLSFALRKMDQRILQSNLIALIEALGYPFLAKSGNEWDRSRGQVSFYRKATPEP